MFLALLLTICELHLLCDGGCLCSALQAIASVFCSNGTDNPANTDLSLTITKNITNSEFSVLLILIILFVAIFFCHGLIRLCVLLVRGPQPEDEESMRSRRRGGPLPQMLGPGGYAIPRRPIRVVLARDEEAAGIESEATKANPPAYGLWRESVVSLWSLFPPTQPALLLSYLPYRNAHEHPLPD